MIIDPNCVQFPSDVLFHSTTDDSRSSNAPVRHSDRAGERRRRGCGLHGRGWLCPICLPLFQLHVGTSPYCRHAPAVPPQIRKAPLPLQMPLLIYQIVDSRVFSSLFLTLFRMAATQIFPNSTTAQPTDRYGASSIYCTGIYYKGTSTDKPRICNEVQVRRHRVQYIRTHWVQ